MPKVICAASTTMKGGLTAEELKEVRAAWQHVLAANVGDLSSGLLLEYVLSHSFLFGTLTGSAVH